MFAFYSGKLGCVGSALLSIVISALLMLLLRGCGGGL